LTPMAHKPVFINAVVEGITDEAIVRKIAGEIRAQLGNFYGWKGKSYIRQKINGFINAARSRPWLVLVDLDMDFECPPPLVERWVPEPPPQLCFRVAVRAAEAWLLADREAIARYLSVPLSFVPVQPENIENPKQSLIELAKRSRNHNITLDMVPDPNSGQKVGTLYASRLVEFTTCHWRPKVARKYSESLDRCIRAIEELVKMNS